MIDTSQILVPMKRWEKIRENWNDTKSRVIETTCLEPLHITVLNIQRKVEEIDDFVISIEKQIEDIEDG